VNKISFGVEKGEILGLLGPNGAGKTTTLSMLATLVKPTSGIAKVNGFDVYNHPSLVRKSIGFVFQDPSSDDTLTGRENLYLHGLMYGVDGINKKIDMVLKLVDLVDKKDILVKNYSGGMRRRLELARGLLHEPKILFLDEPTLGLDPQTRINLWNYIKKLSSEGSVSVIITTHYMDEAEELCDRIAIIDHGKIVAMDSPSDLKNKIGGDIVRLKIKNPKIGEIKKLKYVKKIKKEGEFTVLTVVNSGLHLQEILKKVGKVEEVELRHPTLNDVFLHYTGRNIREAEGEGGWAERAMSYQGRST
jgi:ABC-2 type transport system ATP-binding protein